MESATAAAAVVIACIVHATAAVSRERDLLGRLNNIRGLRALVAELADKVLILTLLRSCQAQSLILIAQRLHLFVAHVVDNAVAKLVNSLEGIAVICLSIKAVLHVHLLFVAEAIGNLLRQVPSSALNANANILNRRASIAAAGSHLRRQIACVLCTLIAQSADSVVDAAEVVVQRIIQRGEAVSKAIGLLVNLADKGLLVNGSANIGLSSTRCRSTSTITAAKAAKTIAAPSKQKEDDNPILLS